MENLTINGLSDNVAYCEAKGLAKCFGFYAENCADETITGIGFNENHSNIYIALENGVTITSTLGNDVRFCVIGDDDDEVFFSTYGDALEFLRIEEI